MYSVPTGSQRSIEAGQSLAGYVQHHRRKGKLLFGSKLLFYMMIIRYFFLNFIAIKMILGFITHYKEFSD